MKDLPATLPPEFRLAAVPQRDASHDVLLAPSRGGWASLRQAARLGTSSIRRCFQALNVRPDLEVLPLRGNVDTRLRRLANGDFDAIILAAAGLKRLGLAGNDENGINVIELDVRNFVPSGGQGALAVESLRDSPVGGSVEIDSAISQLTDSSTFAEITAERAFLAAIGASCVSPVGVNGSAVDEGLTLRAQLFSGDGAHCHAAELTDKLPAFNGEPLERSAARLGERLGQLMLEQGAGKFIGRE
jgi:hydroxymethylbilane synthase